MRRSLVRIFAVAVGASGAIALAGAVSPLFDAINHFAPIWFIAASMAALLAHFGGKSRAFTFAALFGVLAHGALIAPEAISRIAQEKATPQAQDLRVLTFNTWASNTTRARSGAYVANANADIAFLQESNPTTEPIITRAAFANRMNCNGLDYACSTTTLSRHPFRGEGREICGVGALTQVEVANIGPVTLVGVHLSRPLPLGVQRRQMQCLARHINAMGDGPIIIAGDFNAAPWSFALRTFDADLPGFRRVTRALPTWPAPGARVSRFRAPSPLAFIPIDHVYVSDDFDIVGVARGPSIGSDHVPVLVRVRAR